MTDRKQIAFKDSIYNQFAKTSGKTHQDKMVHLLAVDKRKTAVMTDVDKKIDNLTEAVDEIRKLLQGVIQ